MGYIDIEEEIINYLEMYDLHECQQEELDEVLDRIEDHCTDIQTNSYDQGYEWGYSNGYIEGESVSDESYKKECFDEGYQQALKDYRIKPGKSCDDPDQLILEL
jgi:hypothetical protein